MFILFYHVTISKTGYFCLPHIALIHLCNNSNNNKVTYIFLGTMLRRYIWGMYVTITPLLLCLTECCVSCLVVSCQRLTDLKRQSAEEQKELEEAMEKLESQYEVRDHVTW